MTISTISQLSAVVASIIKNLQNILFFHIFFFAWQNYAIRIYMKLHINKNYNKASLITYVFFKI